MQENQSLIPTVDPMVDIPAEMVIEVAIGIGKLEDITARYGYSLQQTSQLRENERFKALVAKTESNLMQEGKLHEYRAAYVSDVALQILHQRAIDPSTSTGQVLDIYKETVKSGNLVPKQNLQQQGSGGYSIKIILPEIGSTPGRTIEMNSFSGEPVEPEPIPSMGMTVPELGTMNRKLNSSIELPEDWDE